MTDIGVINEGMANFGELIDQNTEDRIDDLALEIEQKILENEARLDELPDYTLGRNMRLNEQAKRKRSDILSLEEAMKDAG